MLIDFIEKKIDSIVLKKKFLYLLFSQIPVSCKIIGRITDQISIRYNPDFLLHIFLLQKMKSKIWLFEPRSNYHYLSRSLEGAHQEVIGLGFFNFYNNLVVVCHFCKA